MIFEYDFVLSICCVRFNVNEDNVGKQNNKDHFAF